MAEKLGLTKDYLRYLPSATFSLVASLNCNPILVTLQQQEGRFIAVGAAEDVVIWDLRLAEKALVFKGDTHQATRLAISPNSAFLAVGYGNGTVKIFDLNTTEEVTTFAGHRSGITALIFDESGHRLASAGNDRNIILWDIVGQVGLVRLADHKGPVTSLCFLPEFNVLVSGSVDTTIKFWDLDTSSCFKTLTAHRTAVTGLALLRGIHLVASSGDTELRVWTLFERKPGETEKPEKPELTLDCDESGVNRIQSVKAGSILRLGRGPCRTLTTDNTGRILACIGTDNMVEMFEFADKSQSKLKMKKREAKARKRMAKQLAAVAEAEKAEAENGETANAGTGAEETADGDIKVKAGELSLKDIVRRLPVLRAETGKVRGVHLAVGLEDEMRLAVTLNRNCVELHSMNLTVSETPPPPRLLRRINSQGHHAEMRAVAFSFDNMGILSACKEEVKLWNRTSLTCLRTIPVDNTVSLAFVPGDRHALAGTQSGKLVIIDLQAGEVLEQIQAHETILKAITITPDMRGCVTGGNDKTVKFWQFELVSEKQDDEEEEYDKEDEDHIERGGKVLSLLNTRSLTMEDAVMALSLSPDGKFIAVALMDSTVRIHFADTLKFFLSLYGHQQPVTCMDISPDGKVIITGSGDRTIKVWGLDFGNVVKSLRAHEDSVLGLQFVPKSRLAFSCSKDGTILHWDFKSFTRIQTIKRPHFGEAMSLSVSPDGRWLVTCGADWAIRLVNRSAEILELGDEQETEREEAETLELANAEQTVVAGRGALLLPSRKTKGSDVAADRIMECLNVCDEFEADSTGAKHPLMVAFRVENASDFLLHTLRMVQTSEMQEALLLLPFSSVTKLLARLPLLLTEEFIGDCELVVRVAVFLVSIHRNPVISSSPLMPNIRTLQKLAVEQVDRLRDVVGMNLQGLRFVQDRMEERDQIQLFEELEMGVATKRKLKHNRKRKIVVR